MEIKHLGDITKINGAAIPVVDVVSFGAPCQDISTAGRRAGMKSSLRGDEDTTRSGLFFDAIRIIKEMREHDRTENLRTGVFVRPRFGVYENVPGALSSPGKEHKGEDWAAVIEEFIKVVKKEPGHVDVPNGGWPYSGCVSGVGDDGNPFSIAWRLHDGQFWGTAQYSDGRMLFSGTPQRRKRIALVADFGGLSAPEVLFERRSLCRDNQTRREEGKEIASGTGDGTEDTGESFTLKIRGGVEWDSSGKRAGKGALVQEERSATLGASQDQTLIQTYRKTSHPVSSGGAQGFEETLVSDTLNGFDNSESRTPIIVYENHSQDSRYREMPDVCETVSAKYGTGGNNQPLVLCIGNGQLDTATHLTEACGTPNCMNGPMTILDMRGDQ